MKKATTYGPMQVGGRQPSHLSSHFAEFAVAMAILVGGYRLLPILH